MAIIKRLPCVGQSGSSALDYVIYKHDESTRAPVLDANGNRELRDDFYLSGINCSAFAFPMEMVQLETIWGKNLAPEDIRMHQFIISYDPGDAKDYLLDGPRAQMLSMTLIRRCLPGTLGIACTHLDGDHHAGNIHTHVFLSSIQFTDEISPLMQYPPARKAGKKLRFSKSTTWEMKKHLAVIVEEANLHPNNLFQIPGDRINNGEYWANYRGQIRLDKENRKRMEAGLGVEETRFRGTKQKLREALQDAMFQSDSMEQFRNKLATQFQVKITENGPYWRFGFIGDAQEYSSFTLGSNYFREEIGRVIEENRLYPERMEEYRAKKARKQELEKIPPKPDISTIAGCRMVFQETGGASPLVDTVRMLAWKMETTEAQETLREKWPPLAASVQFLAKHKVCSMAQLDPLEARLLGKLDHCHTRRLLSESNLRDRINIQYYAGVLERHKEQSNVKTDRASAEAGIVDFKTIQEVEDAKRFLRKAGMAENTSEEQAWKEKMEAQRVTDRYREIEKETGLELRTLADTRAALEPWKEQLPSHPVPVSHAVEVITPEKMRSREEVYRAYLQQSDLLQVRGEKETPPVNTALTDMTQTERLTAETLPKAAGAEPFRCDFIIEVDMEPVVEIGGKEENLQEKEVGESAFGDDAVTASENATEEPGEAEISEKEQDQIAENGKDWKEQKKQEHFHPKLDDPLKEERDERIRKLMERRRNASADRTAAERAGSEGTGEASALIREAEAGIHRADTIEENSRSERDDKVAQRADRDAERERHAAEERERAERERRLEAERSRAKRSRSRSGDFER